MTEAYVEHLCAHCCIVRVGAAGPFPAPYRYSVFAVHSGDYAEIVGFDHPDPAPSEYRTVIALLNKATGKLVAYDRAGPPPTRVVQIDPGLIKGKIAMTKLHTHVTTPNAVKKDDTIDKSELAKDSEHARDAFLHGRETMLDVGRVDVMGVFPIDFFMHVASDQLEAARDRLVDHFNRLIAERDAAK